MIGSMQDWPLTLNKVLEHANSSTPGREVVTRSIEGPMVRTTYGEIHGRARQVSAALRNAGVEKGCRVATLAWNSARHMEVWFGTMGIGAVLHTLNPRLFPEQLAWIINHAEDKIIFVDLTFVPLLEKLAASIPTVQRFVVLTDSAHMPQTTLPNAVAYEDFIAGWAQDIAWGGFEETTPAGLCYTSGTTGNPKGVLYSHRANVIHALAANQPDCFGITAADTVLPVVPLFHANAWALTFVGPMAGCKMVMPGAKLDGASVHELLETERVTITAAVPTVWLMLLQHLQATNGKLTTLKKVTIGGSAVPEKVLRAFEDDYGVEVIHAWGMTEMSPIGSLGKLAPQHVGADHETRIKLKMKQGRPLFTVEMKIVDDAGVEKPHDGQAFGRLLVRGPAVVKSYFRGDGARRADGAALDEDGWFDTGDVATIDADGYMQITDRAKDVIKSGGEWISSIDIENIAVGAPGRCHPNQGRVLGLFGRQNRQMVDAGRRPVRGKDSVGRNGENQ
jgi:fatty-acyl-CoA synthase